VSKKLTAILMLIAMAGIAFAFSSIPQLYRIDMKETIGLCYKESPDWTCINSGQPKGFLTYTVVNEELELDLMLLRLDDNYRYQITLNGDGTNNHNVDNLLAGMSNDRWIGGCWNGTRVNSPPCNAGEEGFYNFEMSAPAGSYVTNLKYSIDLPEGIYEGVKFIVKRTTGSDGKGGDFKPVLMEKDLMNFVIVRP